MSAFGKARKLAARLARALSRCSGQWGRRVALPGRGRLGATSLPATDGIAFRRDHCRKPVGHFRHLADWQRIAMWPYPPLSQGPVGPRHSRPFPLWPRLWARRPLLHAGVSQGGGRMTSVGGEPSQPLCRSGRAARAAMGAVSCRSAQDHFRDYDAFIRARPPMPSTPRGGSPRYAR